MIIVKNPSLKARVIKSMNYWDSLAMKAYRRGDMVNGRKYEARSDKLYKQNYHKIFRVV